MKKLRTIPLVVGAISFACVAVHATENKSESPSLSATDKIEIIETIEITSEKKIDSSKSEKLDEDIAAILEDLEAEEEAIEEVLEAISATTIAIDSLNQKSKSDKKIATDSVESNKTVEQTADSTDSTDKTKLKKSKKVKPKEDPK
ncbi:MAG: hypothetical protein OXG08_08620 [Gammaproteobacteria bacterium]|nr:hypothetical protein [Gammaproteobacteria bacterium]